MSWQPCKPKDHSWEPIQERFGRYKCVGCDVIGYRAAIIGNYPARIPQMHPGAIIPYACPRKCDGPTTVQNKSCPACKSNG